MNNLCPISNKDFNSLITIKFSNINSGFNSFDNGILECQNTLLSFEEKEKLFLNFFNAALKLNNNYVLIDFYLNNLNGEEILTLLNALDYNNKIILLQELKELKNDSIYFSLDSNKLMDFITILNTRNLFFCTIYFKNLPFTIWGNYDLKFPIFFNDIENLKIYNEIALNSGLHITNISKKQI